MSGTEDLFDEDGVYLGTEYLIAVFDVPEHDPPAARVVGTSIEFVSVEHLKVIADQIPEGDPERELKVLERQADAIDGLIVTAARDIELQDRIRSWPHARLNNSSSSLPGRPAAP